MELDLDRTLQLLNALHAAINVPNTANIQRAIQDEIREINEDLAPQQQPTMVGQNERGRAYPSGPETPTDDSGASHGMDKEVLPQESRRL